MSYVHILQWCSYLSLNYTGLKEARGEGSSQTNWVEWQVCCNRRIHLSWNFLKLLCSITVLLIFDLFIYCLSTRQSYCCVHLECVCGFYFLLDNLIGFSSSYISTFNFIVVLKLHQLTKLKEEHFFFFFFKFFIIKKYCITTYSSGDQHLIIDHEANPFRCCCIKVFCHAKSYFLFFFITVCHDAQTQSFQWKQKNCKIAHCFAVGCQISFQPTSTLLQNSRL